VPEIWEWDHERGRYTKEEGTNWRFSTFKPPHLPNGMQDRTKVAILIGYRTLRPQDTSDPHETLRHRCRNVSRHFGTKTWFETLRNWCRNVLRHFGTRWRKIWTLRHQDNWDETLRHWCRSVLRGKVGTLRHQDNSNETLGLKCLKTLRHQIEEKSGHFGTRTIRTRNFGTGTEVS